MGDKGVLGARLSWLASGECSAARTGRVEGEREPGVRDLDLQRRRDREREREMGPTAAGTPISRSGRGNLPCTKNRWREVACLILYANPPPTEEKQTKSQKQAPPPPPPTLTCTDSPREREEASNRKYSWRTQSQSVATTLTQTHTISCSRAGFHPGHHTETHNEITVTTNNAETSTHNGAVWF